MEFKSYGFKRPTPVDIQYNSSFNALDRAVFREILALCDNKDRPLDFWHGNKHYTIELKKGQCIFRVQPFSEEMGIVHKRVRKSIEKLKKWYTELETEAKPYGVLVSLKDYDNIVKMETEVENDGKPMGNRKETEGRASNTEDIEVTDEEEGERARAEPKKKAQAFVFSPPTREEVVSYFSEKGYKTDAAERAFEYYHSAGWRDSRGNAVRNWKQKMIAVWFKDENKKPERVRDYDILPKI